VGHCDDAGLRNFNWVPEPACARREGIERVRLKREEEMSRRLTSVLAAASCGATALAALPAEVLAGPMSAARSTSFGLTASVEKAYYRGYRRGYYRRGYGYGSGAAVAGAAAGLLGAGIAGASGYGYPSYGYPGYGYGGYGYGGGYGGSSCYQWDPGAGWVWRC
jgi:hypothetical protein